MANPITSHSSITTHGLFGGQPPAKPVAVVQDNKRVLIDVGGHGDCGFRTLAAGLIDNLLANKRINSELINTILPRHYRYFPSQKPDINGLATPLERLKELLNRVRLTELIPTLAYTLRQIAVDELVNTPEQYRGAFIGTHENTSPAAMRKTETYIDESAITALAHRLDLPVDLELMDGRKVLPMHLHYNPDGKNHAIKIQLNNQHYKFYGTHGHEFALESFHQAHPISPAIAEEPQDLELSEILKRIAAEDKRLLESFERIKTRLEFMVLDGELTTDSLRDIYIRGMDNSDYLTGRVDSVTKEQGSQQFFDYLLGKKGESLSSGSYEEQVRHELIHAIARAVTIGQMNPDLVFAEEHLTGNQVSR